ncbi:polyadenylate-binding protein 2 isoform X3 [Octopus vulgaris]|nr:polyadenylate-binding protein 2 isoform X3 [Octopus vulgaris]
MEEEAEKLKELQSEVEKQMNISAATPNFPTFEEKMEADQRSIFVGNVDYGATAEELEQHFHGCGSVNRVTILCDKYSGHPKGFAYVEFADKDSVGTAMALDESLFRARQIKVSKLHHCIDFTKTSEIKGGWGLKPFTHNNNSILVSNIAVTS